MSTKVSCSYCLISCPREITLIILKNKKPTKKYYYLKNTVVLLIKNAKLSTERACMFQPWHLFLVNIFENTIIMNDFISKLTVQKPFHMYI